MIRKQSQRIKYFCSKPADSKPKDSQADQPAEPQVVEKRQLPAEPEDFIEPYDGKTFEKHRAFFPGKQP